MPTTRRMARPRKAVNTDTYTGRFAVRLKSLREKAGLSVDELAEKSGIPAQTLYCWERSSRTPAIDRFPELAEALEVSIRTLLPKE